MDSILIILRKKWPKGFICPYTGTISIYNICIYSRSQVSVYRTIGPLVSKSKSLFLTIFIRCTNQFVSHLVGNIKVKFSDV